jgi:N-acetylmuramic acid 6-phosphate (MurNAc-6-P) etherase
MKGGSMTKVLLETIFIKAISDLHFNGKLQVLDILQGYQQVSIQTYVQSKQIANAVRLGAESLRAGGHIYYIGAHSAGILGFIDASE